MKHTTYKFTIKFTVSDDVPAKDVISDYIEMVTINMPNKCVEVGKIQTIYWQNKCFVTYLDLVPQDYGVPQVSVVLTAKWIKQLYRESVEDLGFKIDAIIIHPRPDHLGAVIKWDWINDCPIVKVIAERQK